MKGIYSYKMQKIITMFVYIYWNYDYFLLKSQERLLQYF